MKTPKQLERYFKGASNHYRIAILDLIDSSNHMTLEMIADELDANIKTISGHTRRLVGAGLLNKKYQGRVVVHSLSPYGKKFLKFMRKF